MQLFYTPEINNEYYTLNQEESRHCVKVLRLSEGSLLHLTNGAGALYKAEVVEANIKACKLKVIEKTEAYNKRNNYLHIAIAPTKNIDRFEWFLEKSTELGIDEITPLLCEHSERKIIKPERLERIIVAAMKQSLKAYKPKLNPLTSFNNFVKSDFSNVNMLIAHCEKDKKVLMQNACKPGDSVCVLIGPEGDFSKNEIDTAFSKGFQGISLGESRLRTETAGLAACHTVSLINQI